MFFFSGHICYVWDIIVVLCCTKCGDCCLKSPQSCKRRFFRDCLLEQLSKPEAAHCSVPLWLPLLHYWIRLTLCLPDKQTQSKLSRNKCIVFLFTSGECGDNKEKQKHFIVPKILLFPDLLFVHCVTFRETKKCGTVVWFGQLRLEFLNFSFHFCYVRWVLRTSKVAGQQGDWWTNQR